MSGIVKGDESADGLREFAKATNNLFLFAPPRVIAALNAYRNEISFSNIPNHIIEKEVKLLTNLIHEIRVDLGISTVAIPEFTVQLWCSGAKKTLPNAK